MAAKSSKIRPEALPPTERAAHFHSLRVYYQLQDWNTLHKNNLNPENWGWKIEGGSYVPIMTDKPPAPNDILNVIRCNCKVTTKNPCGSNICSCRASGLNCVAACGDCRGSECRNLSEIVLEDEHLELIECDENIFDNS